eukprot:4226143-Pyramimonas_sp.AAC.1
MPRNPSVHSVSRATHPRGRLLTFYSCENRAPSRQHASLFQVEHMLIQAKRALAQQVLVNIIIQVACHCVALPLRSTSRLPRVHATASHYCRNNAKRALRIPETLQKLTAHDSHNELFGALSTPLYRDESAPTSHARPTA